MSLMNTFVNEPEKLAENMDKIRSAERPRFFDKEFLISLGINESNAILYKNLFISLGFVQQNSQPTTDYGQFVGSDEESASILAEKIWEKYTSLFAEERHIHEKNEKEITEIFKKVYGKDHSDSFIHLMSSTFKALVDYAGIGTIKKQAAGELVTEEIHVNGNGVKSDLDDVNKEKTDGEMDDQDIYESDVSYTDGEFEGDEVEIEHAEEEGTDTDKSVEHLMDLISKRSRTTDPKEKKEEDYPMDNEIIEQTDTAEDQTQAGQKTKNSFLDKALFKRAELLVKLNRKEEAVNAFDHIVEYLENQDSDHKDKIAEILIRKAELLEELGNDEKTLEAYEEYIDRFSKIN